jgi:hypothetical protein
MNLTSIITLLKKHKNPKTIAGMARFGISIPFLRALAKKIGKNLL